jgi:uncharacterized membrane protein
MPVFAALLFASVWAVATVALATGTAIVTGDRHGALFWSIVAVLAMVAVVLVRATGGMGRRVLDLTPWSPPNG